MPKVYFLDAGVPLTKRFFINQAGELDKDPYPNVSLFTSFKEEIATTKDLHAAITKHSAKGRCLLKGTIAKPLINARRRSSTKTETLTEWICLDLDKAPFKSPQQFIDSIPALKDVSYVVQYSASQGLPKAKGLSCHIYMLLSKPHNPTHLKAWLMHLNLTDLALRGALTLTGSHAYLHWPLDITCCQNDKLIYITRPTLGVGVKYSLSATDLIQLVPGKLPHLDTSKIKCDSFDKSKKDMREIINEARKQLHLKPLLSEPKWVGEYEVQSKPGAQQMTGQREANDFMYFNINGGDSWGYYHPKGNFELIHNFKGEPTYYTKEIFPEYYKQCREERMEESAQPTEDGLIILGIRNRMTSTLHNITYDPTNHKLEVLPASNMTLLDHFLQGYGKLGYMEQSIPIPTWTLTFNPQSNTVVDDTAKTINQFVLSPYMRALRKPVRNLDACPLIKRVILSAVSNNEFNATTEHFLNWLACIFQYRIKTTTAWVLHGVYGTGKQVLVNRIIRPLLGPGNVQARRASELEEKYSGWLENVLVAFVDEIKVSASSRKDLIEGDLKNFITDSPISIRHMNRISYEVDSFVNLIFGSNEPDPVIIKKGDRRYNVGDFQKKRLFMTIKELNAIHEELPTFCDYIMQRPACKDTAAQILSNAARSDIIAANRTSVDMVCDALLEGDFSFLYDSLPDRDLINDLHGANNVMALAYHEMITLKARLIATHGKQSRDGKCLDDKLSRDELNIIFQYCIGNMPISPNKFTRLLKHHGITTKRIRINDTATHGMDVTWKVDNHWLAEHIKEFIDKPKQLRRIK